MLPIVGKDIEGQKVSIYNEAVQTRHPLLGLKFKNTSGAHLKQGPITVFEGSVYAGDTRVLDVQPNEERLVSYAIDLGTEVDAQVGPGTQKITSVKAVKGIVTTVTKVMEEKKYKVINRCRPTGRSSSSTPTGPTRSSSWSIPRSRWRRRRRSTASRPS